MVAPRRDEASSLAPFRDHDFAVLCPGTVVSNIGTWMQSAAAGWLMTGLDPAPVSVSLVQVAASLPMFMFALPAGALADVVDRRRLLIVMQVAVTVLVAGFGLVVYLSWATPNLLLAFTFTAGARIDHASMASDRSPVGAPAASSAGRRPQQRRP
jgi:MFS family permease